MLVSILVAEQVKKQTKQLNLNLNDRSTTKNHDANTRRKKRLAMSIFGTITLI